MTPTDLYSRFANITRIVMAWAERVAVIAALLFMIGITYYGFALLINLF